MLLSVPASNANFDDIARLNRSLSLAELGRFVLAMFPRDAGLQAFYFLFFGAFATGPFHREQRGLPLIACCAAWVGLVASVGWLLSQENAKGALTACCASALLLALVGSRRLGRFQYKVVRPEQAA